MNEQLLREIKWMNVLALSYLHMASVYAVYLMFTSAKWQTNAFWLFLYLFSGLGITAGAHRLWCHRSYKAKFPLRVLLAFMFTMSFEHEIYDWARDHRVHHKYSDTNADPHNSSRGFFFSHVGWLMLRKHPDVVTKGKTVDMSDILADPVVRFQRRYYKWLVAICSFILPTIIPIFMWNETFRNSFFICTIFRICFTHNQSWLVNSAAHMWGNRPYDVTINPRENIFTITMALGEGFHNYHHAFPYDYSASEYGFKYNITTTFIDLMAWLGLAYDRKMVSKELIEARKLRTGENNMGKLHSKENGAITE